MVVVKPSLLAPWFATSLLYYRAPLTFSYPAASARVMAGVLKLGNGHQHILVATEYYTKWVEAESYTTIEANHVAQFIRKHIVCRFGIPKSDRLL